ncbi:MAG: hypothetical protein KatS3mg005_1261 [Bryobacteraceae bacterium]|nr:MAG: hypothetical protein KatS3mg005_1261 [Bryobacteraceae bacterium]
MYRIGGPVERYKTLRDSVTHAVTGVGRRLRGLFGGGNGTGSGYETIWALKDVSFEVQPGEVVGIIGRNGAGKSTLLKILSRITEPTEGRVEIRGRVGSLLEVGTGFHPELTGRENVYLNGAILGMTRAEVDRKFDEIVAFAEVEKFIDTPVKHYSSGMYLRLAFAVAAHLDPEILLVDEVLAVGDQAFQSKCLGTMQRAAGEGRTVLFVSHQMAAVQALCESAIELARGKIVVHGEARDVVLDYQRRCILSGASAMRGAALEKVGGLELKQPFLMDLSGAAVETIACGEELVFCLPYQWDREPTSKALDLSIGFRNQHGAEVAACPSTVFGERLSISGSQGEIHCRIPRVPLVPGLYAVDLWVEVDKEHRAKFNEVLQLEVMPGDYYGTGRVPHRKQSGVLIDYAWTIGKGSDA